MAGGSCAGGAAGALIRRFPGITVDRGFIISDRHGSHESSNATHRSLFVRVTPRSNKSQQDHQSHFPVNPDIVADVHIFALGCRVAAGSASQRQSVTQDAASCPCRRARRRGSEPPPTSPELESRKRGAIAAIARKPISQHSLHFKHRVLTQTTAPSNGGADNGRYDMKPYFLMLLISTIVACSDLMKGRDASSRQRGRLVFGWAGSRAMAQMRAPKGLP